MSCGKYIRPALKNKCEGSLHLLSQVVIFNYTYHGHSGKRSLRRKGLFLSMSKSRMINTRFWSDGFVVDKLNALDRLLFLYLLTNDKANILGIYEIPLRVAAFETGIDKDDLSKMLSRLSPKVEFFDGWVYIRQFVEHQQNNPNVEKGLMREIFSLPDDVIRKIFEFGIDSPRLSKAFESLSKHYKEVDKPVLNLDLDLTKPKGNKETKVSLRDKKSKKVPTKTADIDKLFAQWGDIVGYDLTSQVKSNRDYAGRLLKEYQPEDIEKMLHGVSLSHEDQYAPRIANFIQLYRKWDDLKAWGRRKQSSGNDTRGVKL